MSQERLGLVVVAGLSLLGLCGCGASDEDEAKQNLQLWREKGPASYVYIMQRSCFCGGTGPTRIVVEDGVVKSAVPTSEQEGAPGETMTSLLEEVVRTARRDNSRYAARFNADLGYLEYESVDHDSRTDDDELTISVACFSPGTSDDACPG